MTAPESMVALEPCPFCGGEAIMSDPHGAFSRLAAVYCEQCEIKGPLAPDANRAAEAWNTRTRITGGDELVSRIVAWLRDYGNRRPSPGLIERQNINEEAIGYGQAVLKAAADHLERGIQGEGDCELCSKPLLLGQFVNQFDDVGTAHANCAAPFAKPTEATPTPNDDGTTMPTYVLLGQPALLEELTANKDGLVEAIRQAALDLHEAAGRFDCVGKLNPKACSELTRGAARRADAALAAHRGGK